MNPNNESEKPDSNLIVHPVQIISFSWLKYTHWADDSYMSITVLSMYINMKSMKIKPEFLPKSHILSIGKKIPRDLAKEHLKCMWWIEYDIKCIS